jgi:hypothetical protein
MHARSGAMPEPHMDGHSALSTATIFDDAVFCSEALCLAVDEAEEKIEAELLMVAAESGIEDPARFLCPPHDVSRALSTVTLDSDRRSSVSIHSQETQSTSFTSAPSRTSRDQAHQSDRLPPMRSPPKPAQMSTVVANKGSAIDVSPVRVEPRLSSSTLSVSQSVVSDSSSQSTPVPHRKRASGFFGLFRKTSRQAYTTRVTVHRINILSSSCTSQSHREYHGKIRGLKLDCGHSLSPHAIRTHIHEAQQESGSVIPNCCGTPLPRKVVDDVLAKEEAELLANRESFSAQVEATQDSRSHKKGASAVDIIRPLEAATLPATSTSLPLVTSRHRRRHEAISIDLALANEAFRNFRSEEKEQFGRVAAFECNQRNALSAHHTSSLKRLVARQEAAKNESMQQVGPHDGSSPDVSLFTLQHLQDLERLEEAQVVAEHDLRKAHAQETQNVATALKHMEAYCLGSDYSHHHVVTEEDFKKLNRQRMIQQDLPRKHENAINVLRARQERGTQNKVQKQATELSLLDVAHERERAAEEFENSKEMEKLEALIETRRRRLLRRWDLRFEIWRRDWEAQNQTIFTLPLEHEIWPLQPTTTMTPIPESSSLAPYVQAAA